MPTVEERLAALETKLAALTETTPTTYYEHQYSGEEIDAAVGRALTGGALDTSVTNVSNQLGTFTRPNLLDNWYFGNPVDQKKGMLQLAGTMLYSDAACTQALFPSTKTTSVVKVSDIAAYPSDNSTVYVKLADCVRGYTGNGYSVDRWKLFGSDHVVTIEDGFIALRKPANTGDFVYAQYFDGATLEALRGKTATISVMDSNGNVYSKTLLIPASGMFDSDNLHIGDNWWIDLIVPSSGNFYIRFVSTTKNETTLGIQSAKLELGPTQTLAHQENGVWVINEVPEYGEQLRRCQRYHYQVHYNQYETIGFAYDGPEYAFIILPLPTEMRGETPTLKIIGDISIGGKVRTLTGCNCHGCEAIIGVNYTAQPSSAGATYAYSTSAGGVTISIIYDL